MPDKPADGFSPEATCPFHVQYIGFDLRPLAMMGAVIDEIVNDVDEAFELPVEDALEGYIEGMLEVDVNDHYITNIEADWLIEQSYEIIRMDRSTVWINPLVFDQGNPVPPRNEAP